MDSVSQFVLGASVGLAISPVKTPKVAIISGALAMLPDLDIFLSYGDDLHDIINHRGFSHSLFVLSLISLPLAKLLARIFKSYKISYKRSLALCLCVLLTHPMLDSFTIFGTQLFWPLPVNSVMIGSMFIIDILYTLPLLISLIIILIKKRLPIIKGLSINTWALGISTGYLLLSLILQSHVINAVGLSKDDINNQFAIPTPSNLIIWRIVAIDDNYIYENFYHLFKGSGEWLKIPHNKQNFNLDNNDVIDKYNRFSHSFYRLNAIDNKLIISDMRMGTINMPIFSFIIAEKNKEQYQAIKPRPAYLQEFIFKKMFGGQDFF